ncbi:hypothetical protein HCUR_00912 [Holospora curviuscula]|uniref:Uncharacterized protein n=1 Tax=Holospora curviuscula TaxID=1082868 RepID=A0A2S5R904_9PROT|nr:hypothetical protein HCUR_00912 [Holospora curviuscula]
MLINEISNLLDKPICLMYLTRDLHSSTPNQEVIADQNFWKQVREIDEGLKKSKNLKRERLEHIS